MFTASILHFLLIWAVKFTATAYSPKHVSMKTWRQRPQELIRHEFDLSLATNSVQSDLLYLVNVSIGTPAQQLLLQLDTGSSDFLIYGPNACHGEYLCESSTYDYTKSKSAKRLSNQFDLNDGPRNNMKGIYVTDTIMLGNATITDVTFAEATNTTNKPPGRIGLGFDSMEFGVRYENEKPYSTILDVMYNQGLITSHSYSIYLDDYSRSSKA